MNDWQEAPGHTTRTGEPDWPDCPCCGEPMLEDDATLTEANEWIHPRCLVELAL